MVNKKGDIKYTGKVSLVNGKILRHVSDTNKFKKIIEILNNLNLLSVYVVGTKIYSEEKQLLEHEFINGIIHSEEFTESMAYDSVIFSMELFIKLQKEGIYGWDLLPYNFTFKNGRWILFDVEALSLSPKLLKSYVRSFFKIILSNCLLHKKLTRTQLKQCFLTRIKTSSLREMISFKMWIYYCFKLRYCIFLAVTKQTDKLIKYLSDLYKKYTYPYEKKVYNTKISQNDYNVFNFIDKQLEEIKTIFCVGETAFKWAITTSNPAEKMIYTDNYEQADEMYNYICKNHCNKLSIGVLYPFESDEKLPKDIPFPAIYDNYAKFRFNYDCAIYLKECNINFAINLSDFANKLLIIKSDEEHLDEISNTLREIYNTVNTLKIDNCSFIYAINKKKPFIYKHTKHSYNNFSRGKLSNLQAEKIIELIKN